MNINPNNLGNYTVPKGTQGGVCLDIGANVGNFFTAYKDHFRMIHYYEAVQETFDICQNKSNTLENITGFREAAHSCDGECLQIVVHNNNESGSCAVLDPSRNGMSDWSEEIASTTTSVSMESVIDRLLKASDAEEIDYLKIDCECCEFEFMLDKDLSNIKHIGMELHCQKGEEYWDRMLKHLRKTHIVKGNTTFAPDRNTELYCVRKDLA